MSKGRRPVRRRGGLIPRLVFALATTLLVVEFGLHLVLGNGGQGFVVQASASRAVCFEIAPGQRVPYTGDAVRAERSWISTTPVGTRGTTFGDDDRLRIAVIGDGLTFGQGVADDQTLAHHVEQELNRRGYRTQVLNLAVPGTSPPQAVARLERELARLKPDAAVLVVAPDDLDPGSSDCPHMGVVSGKEVLSAGAAQRQLQELLSTRLYIVRAVRLVREAGLEGLLDRRGPYGPGRLRRAGTKGVTTAALLPPGPVFTATRTPQELWGDVPILMPGERDVPAVVPEGREEYAFVSAVQRLRELGLKHEFPVAVAVLADRNSFREISACEDCRAPQQLLAAEDDVRVVDLGSWWAQMVRQPREWFQPGEGWLNAAGHEELGRALASDLAFWSELRREAN